MPLSPIPEKTIYSNEGDDIVQVVNVGTTVTNDISGWVFDPIQFMSYDVRTTDVTSASLTGFVTYEDTTSVKVICNKDQTSDLVVEGRSSSDFYGDISGLDTDGYQRTLTKIRLIMNRKWKVT